MLASPSSVGAALLRAEDFLADAERERIARQAEVRVKTERAPQPSLIAAIRSMRDLLTNRAAVAFGLSGS